MSEITPGDLNTVKLVNSGSEATEAAIKMARQYHRQTGHQQKFKIINAYAVPPAVSPLAASLAEPFASSLEALSRAGGVRGKMVCVFGDGPFGLIICRMARRQGALVRALRLAHGLGARLRRADP